MSRGGGFPRETASSWMRFSPAPLARLGVLHGDTTHLRTYPLLESNPVELHRVAQRQVLSFRRQVALALAHARAFGLYI